MFQLIFLLTPAWRMETLIGIAGKNFAVIAANKNISRSVVVMKHTEDRLLQINKKCVMGLCGDFGDALALGEYIKANVSLEENREDGRHMSMNSISSYVRKEIAGSLRSREAYQTNALVAGCDASETGSIPSIYWIDYLATITKTPFAVHGHASFFCSSILDRNYREGMNEEEVLSLLRECFQELQRRFAVNQGEFVIKLIDTNGVRLIV